MTFVVLLSHTLKLTNWYNQLLYDLGPLLKSSRKAQYRPLFAGGRLKMQDLSRQCRCTFSDPEFSALRLCSSDSYFVSLLFYRTMLCVSRTMMSTCLSVWHLSHTRYFLRAAIHVEILVAHHITSFWFSEF